MWFLVALSIEAPILTMLITNAFHPDDLPLIRAYRIKVLGESKLPTYGGEETRLSE